MHICRIKSLYYICGIWVQSIPSLPNLCVHWKLESQGIKPQSTSWTPSLIFSALEPHPAADSNRTCAIKPNQWGDDSQPWSQYQLQIKIIKLCCHYSGTSSCFLLSFSLGKKFFPFTSPSQLANSPSRLQGSHPREVPCDLKGWSWNPWLWEYPLGKFLLLYIGFIEISRMFLCFKEIKKTKKSCGIKSSTWGCQSKCVRPQIRKLVRHSGRRFGAGPDL